MYNTFENVVLISLDKIERIRERSRSVCLIVVSYLTGCLLLSLICIPCQAVELLIKAFTVNFSYPLSQNTDENRKGNAIWKYVHAKYQIKLILFFFLSKCLAFPLKKCWKGFFIKYSYSKEVLPERIFGTIVFEPSFTTWKCNTCMHIDTFKTQ